MNLFVRTPPSPSVRTAAECIARNRFGLGGAPGETIGDPQRWLLGQFARYDPSPRAIPPRPVDPCVRLSKNVGPGAEQCGAVLVRDFAARFAIARTSETPFVERLVHFWSNHFAVIGSRSGRERVGGFEFEAIRPHVLGSFRDLLGAAMHHPAMLISLDQHLSAGPRSRGHRGRRPVENLARELLELHTLGVRTGYSQADVGELALALTGWTVDLPGGAGTPGRFRFDPEIHEPGPRRLLGQVFAEGGQEQAEAVLDHLATAPATARHVATKLARHFAGDEPTPALVDRLARTFVESKGDLPTVYAALIRSPEAWAAGRPKFKTPWEWLISVGRATDADLSSNLADTARQLGQMAWEPPSPAGFDDVAGAWTGPDALLRRVKLAESLAKTLPPREAIPLAADLLGPTLGRSTDKVLRETRDGRTALALLLVSPEFLYR